MGLTDEIAKVEAPSEPWTTEERLHAFYTKYDETKLDNIPSLLQKYQGKEEKLFTALVKKYGPEPDDPYVTAKDGEEGDDEEETQLSKLSIEDKRKAVTIVHGMETIPDVKLKDVAKAFSKRFAGSSSVKDSSDGKSKEIIIQGDHSEEVAAWIVQNFKIDPEMVFFDQNGEFVPFG